MLIDLKEIRSIRRKLGMTQKELSDMSGVSQSLIAKVESGRMDPSYSNAQKLIKALEEATKSNEKSAKDLMHTKIISVNPKDKISKAIKCMRKNGISQLPVVEDKKPAGYLTEVNILNDLMNGKSSDSMVKEFMIDTPPIVDKYTQSKVISELLKFYQMVLVAEKGKLVGVITRSDILDQI